MHPYTELLRREGVIEDTEMIESEEVVVFPTPETNQGKNLWEVCQYSDY